MNRILGKPGEPQFKVMASRVGQTVASFISFPRGKDVLDN